MIQEVTAPRFTTPLRIEQVGSNGDRRWMLTERLVFHSAILGRFVMVSAGFESDLASVPRVPIAWLVAGGCANRAAVLHDYLYRIGWPSRRLADRVFLEAMTVDRDPRSAVKRRLMFWAVRCFGFAAWRASRRARKAQVAA